MPAPIRNAHRKSVNKGDPTSLRAFVRGTITRGIGAEADAEPYKVKQGRDAIAWADAKGLTVGGRPARAFYRGA